MTEYISPWRGPDEKPARKGFYISRPLSQSLNTKIRLWDGRAWQNLLAYMVPVIFSESISQNIEWMDIQPLIEEGKK